MSDVTPRAELATPASRAPSRLESLASLPGLARLARRVAASEHLQIVLLWAGYIFAVEALCTVLVHDPHYQVPPNFQAQLYNFVGPASTLPALCRWDCAWYVQIAGGPYPGIGIASHSGAFFPFYGLVVRWFGHLFHLEAAWAAVWVSRLALLGTCLLVFEIAPSFEVRGERRIAAVVGLLATPAAFIFIAGYGDGLFLFFSIASAALMLRKQPLLGAIPAACAGLTRIHACALAVGLLALGLREALRSPRGPKRWLQLAPAFACGGAILGLVAYLWRVTGDPLLFIHEQAYYGKSAAGPMAAVHALVLTEQQHWPPKNLGEMYWALTPAFGVAWLCVLGYFLTKRRWVELAYTGAMYGMILTSGTHWGSVRYLAEIFPCCFAIAALYRWRGVWTAYLFAGVMLQLCFLENFVALAAPAP